MLQMRVKSIVRNIKIFSKAIMVVAHYCCIMRTPDQHIFYDKYAF